MLKSSVELALGTAQFGSIYGIANSGKPILASDVRTILARAWQLGIHVLDTAPLYGKIEDQLVDLTGDLPYSIVSKIPPVSCELSKNAIEDFVGESIVQTKARLGSRLSALLFHRSSDLFDQKGNIAWTSAINVLENDTIQLGVSCYSPAELIALQKLYPLKLAQLPGNAFDQRLKMTGGIDKNIELFLRSAFLQGVLLLSTQKLVLKLPHANSLHAQWSVWCQERNMTPLQAALSLVKGFPGIRYCVVGVDSLLQLEEICEAWSFASPMHAPELASDDEGIIDPRRWIL